MMPSTVTTLILFLFSVAFGVEAMAITKVNLIKNGGFEVLDSTTSKPVDWVISGTGGPLFHVSDLIPGSGEYTQGITWYRTSISQPPSTPLLPNTKYHLEFFYQVQAVATDPRFCSLNITLGDAKADEISRNKFPITKMSIDLDVTEGGEGELAFTGICPYPSGMMFDDIVLTQA